MPEFNPGTWVLDPATGEQFWCFAVDYDDDGACWLALNAMEPDGIVSEFQWPAWRLTPVTAP